MKVREAANAAESRARDIAERVARAAAARPDDELLQIYAQIAATLVGNAELRAMIPRLSAEERLTAFQVESLEVLHQLNEGLLSPGEAKLRLEQVELSLTVRLAEHRLSAWEWALAELAKGIERSIPDGT